tara:strand:+ start:1629 stop:1808 length:180 start_codon:yes stop_codon:yes gene_type:complete
MALKILASDKEKQLLIDALADKGKPLVEKEKKQKLTKEEQRTMASIANLISQIAFGNDK